LVIKFIYFTSFKFYNLHKLYDRLGIAPLFSFPEEIRRVIYTTNAIESVNRQIRKIIKNKGVFPDDKSIHKIIYLALKNAAKKWTMPIKNWPLALNQFEILCGEYRHDLIEQKITTYTN